MDALVAAVRERRDGPNRRMVAAETVCRQLRLEEPALIASVLVMIRSHGLSMPGLAFLDWAGPHDVATTPARIGAAAGRLLVEEPWMAEEQSRHGRVLQRLVGDVTSSSEDGCRPAGPVPVPMVSVRAFERQLTAPDLREVALRRLCWLLVARDMAAIELVCARARAETPGLIALHPALTVERCRAEARAFLHLAGTLEAMPGELVTEYEQSVPGGQRPIVAAVLLLLAKEAVQAAASAEPDEIIVKPAVHQ